ncbi:MAG: Xaa-Pro dipeptidase [Hyphomicrobiaceae bacterium]|jgi:Xaa-Pro dipeptidase
MTEPAFAGDFPDAEFTVRLERAQRSMAAEKLDALLITTEAELRYFSGFRTLFWQSPTRPWFLIVPAAGKPIAVVPEIGAALMRATWIDDVRTWAAPHASDDGVSLLTAAMAGYARVGMSMGRASALRMPLTDFQRVRDALPGTQWSDASVLLRNLRMVKSEAEIDKIRAICAIGSAAFERGTELFHEGQPLDEVFRAFKIELLRQGAEDVPYLVGGAGSGGYADVISPPSARPLQRGDVLMLDTGATRHGYFCDFDRNFAIGPPSEAATTANDVLWRATEAGLAVARPGATCADVYRAMANVIGQGDGDVGRLGHALGSELTEEPSLISWDQTVLQAGMVMTLEPSMVVAGDAIMVHEENIVVRDGAPELLTKRAAPELVAI